MLMSVDIFLKTEKHWDNYQRNNKNYFLKFEKFKIPFFWDHPFPVI